MNNVKKSIGWADWTINPVKGLCPVGCSYCYARRAYGRNCNATFKDKSIRYTPEVFIDLYKAKPGDRIFVGSTIDLFHPLASMWTNEIIDYCARARDFTFIFLTKCPENLPKEFPDNCWVGVSVDGTPENSPMSLAGLRDCNAKVKFISFEPLLGHVNVPFKLIGVNWVIIGRQTPVSQKTSPKIEWVKEIVDAADSAKMPVFLKSNLESLITHMTPPEYNKMCYGARLRQEIPEAK
jgi:protein gp37